MVKPRRHNLAYAKVVTVLADKKQVCHLTIPEPMHCVHCAGALGHSVAIGATSGEWL